MARLIELEKDGERLCISFPYNREIVDVVRGLPRRRFDRETKSWFVPLEHLDQVVGRLHRHNFSFGELLEAHLLEQQIEVDALARESRAKNRPFIAEERLPAGTWTVARLNHHVQQLLRDAFREEVWIAAEIQSFDRNKRRGHAFFELIHRQFEGSDPSAKTSAVMWADDRERIERALAEDGGNVRLRDGLVVRFLVRVDFYTGQGRYQLTVSEIDLAYTTGTIHQRREAVMRELDARGVIAKNLERPWPLVPMRIGLITADESDALADFLHELGSSGYGFDVTLFPANMQGSNTETSMLRALAFFAKHAEHFDALAIVRGGGARSDLAYFDTERIGVAVCEHPLKVIVGIGHQRDVCLLDLISYSEKTPTAAATHFVDRARDYLARQRELKEQILGNVQMMLEHASDQTRYTSEHALRVIGDVIERQSRQLDRFAYGISQGATARHEVARRKLERLAGQIPASAHTSARLSRSKVDFAAQRLGVERMERRFERAKARLHEKAVGLERASVRSVERARGALEERQTKLRLLDPERVLERGFALVKKGDKVVRDVSEVSAGDALRVHVARGRISVRVEEDE